MCILRIFTSFTNFRLKVNIMVSLRFGLSSTEKKINKDMKNNLNS